MLFKSQNWLIYCRFEVNWDTKLAGQIPPLPTSNWQNIVPLGQTKTISKNVNGGSCLMLWVRAYDIVNNTAVDGVTVCFDSTGPIFRSLEMTGLNENPKGFEHGGSV